METKLKRVRIKPDNMELIEKMAESSKLSVNDYLDYLVNRAIVDEYNKSKQTVPLYVWKS